MSTSYLTSGPALSAVDAGRKIERLIISHSSFVVAKNQLVRLADLAHQLRDPGGLVLAGESGTGKDSLIDAMKLLMPSSNLLDSVHRRLVIVNTDAAPSVGDFTAKMLIQLGYSFAKFGKADNSERRDILVEALIACRVRLMLLNEFQHVIEGNRNKLGHALADWFKRLYDDTRIPMVFLGTPVVLRVLDINEQFASRFSGIYRLNPLENSPEFLGILKAFDVAVPELAPAGLATSRFSKRIHKATGGVMRPLKRLIKEAVMLAVTESESKVALRHFREAYQRIHGEYSGENPFLET